MAMTKISNGVGAQLFSRLATGYHAGLDLRTLWQREAQSVRPQLARSSRVVLDEIGKGSTLAEAMTKTNGYFSPLTIAVVKAGETSGRLEQSFRRLSNHFETWHRFRNDLLLALAWPLFELAFSIVVIGALILLMGWAMSGSGQDGIDWFGWGWGTWDYFRAYVACVCLGLTIVGLLWIGNKLEWFGSWPSRFARYIPIVGGILHNLSLARFSWALSSALGAGMDVGDSLRLGLHASQNRKFLETEPLISEEIVGNQPIYETLNKTRRFPEEFLTLVSNGEVSGTLPETLDRASEMYQERVKSGLTLLKTATFVATLLIVGLILGAAILFLFNKVYLGTMRELGL
jgi:type IV pilus assembly protein PilC